MADDTEWTPKQDMSLLCRVCANQHDYLIPIFQGEGLDHDMPTKMDKHLPIKVRESDKLPTQMCYQCASTIIAWSELHTNCLAADKKLKGMLRINEKKMGVVDTADDDAGSDHYEDAYDDGGGGGDDDDEDFEKEIKQLISDAGVELGSKTAKASKRPSRAAATRKRKSEVTITPVKRETKKPKTEPSASKSSTALLKPKEEVVSNEDRCIEVWSCCTCERYFSSHSGLRSHLLSHVGKSNDHDDDVDEKEEKYCLQCPNLFISHYQTGPSSNIYICDYCDECMANKRLLRIHIKLEHNVMSIVYYTCKLCCKKLFNNSKDILEHLRISHKITNVDLSEFQAQSLNDVKFVCKLCNDLCILSDVCESCDTKHGEKSKGNDLKLPSNCANHKDSHFCSTCLGKFEDCSSLWTHLYSNHKEVLSQIKCNLCPISPVRDFKQPSLLIRHMKRAHKKKINIVNETKQLRKKCRVVLDGKVRFQCPHCGQELRSFWNLKEHIHIHTGEKSHTCTICQKKFRFKTRLQTHYKSVHENSRKYKCVYCGHSFNEKSNLTVHLRIHTGEKKYICEQCGASFAQWAGLYYHKFTHNDSKFQCSYCERAYSIPSDLQKHVKTHTDHRLYVCEVCGKVFSTFKNMRRHTKIHNTARVFVCEMCNASFNVKKYLTQHYKVHMKKST